ncbi:hypothetical protein A0H81_02686 [Grifola frondosa]|uniref:Uncharacterized protein n=1 Tax=Grifola frondosa TaxID=5627 RepID=A0A1C7MMA9_GRIFR|nr:hypothetical protein A0H81_02686 [Grifola frondosa]
MRCVLAVEVQRHPHTLATAMIDKNDEFFQESGSQSYSGRSPPSYRAPAGYPAQSSYGAYAIDSGPSGSDFKQGGADGPPPVPPSPYAPSPGGGSAPLGKKPGMLRRLAPGKSPSDLLNPPPPSFLRAPPSNLPYGPFPPMTLIGLGKGLDKGYPLVAPQSPLIPHPFVMHDVNKDDWLRFLNDIRLAGSLSPMNRVLACLAPIALGGIGIIIGFFVVKGIESQLKKSKKGPVSQVIEQWNRHFFNPRGIHIALTRGPIPGVGGPSGGPSTQNAQLKKIERHWRLVISFIPYIPM